MNRVLMEGKFILELRLYAKGVVQMWIVAHQSTTATRVKSKGNSDCNDAVLLFMVPHFLIAWVFIDIHEKF